MLRTYKPLVSHTVFAYQILIEHLISNVWCNAEEGVDCISLLSADFEIIYSSREWVKDSVDSIYELCKLLTPDERAEIREAFVINNCINDFCEATKKPIELSQLPKVVTDLMKDFLIKCYSDLISAKEKLDYYNELIKKNKSIKFCPCCGLLPIESPESKYREDNDHYLPKAEYPFASVNFDNLPPLCSKCNKKCKSTKNPFESTQADSHSTEGHTSSQDMSDTELNILKPSHNSNLAGKKRKLSETDEGLAEQFYSYNPDSKKPKLSHTENNLQQSAQEHISQDSLPE
ncbi:MAG: hypothetical protein EOP45_17635, partial [Sphingobacteriaceae bacterium]